MQLAHFLTVLFAASISTGALMATHAAETSAHHQALYKRNPAQIHLYKRGIYRTLMGSASQPLIVAGLVKIMQLAPPPLRWVAPVLVPKVFRFLTKTTNKKSGGGGAASKLASIVTSQLKDPKKAAETKTALAKAGELLGSSAKNNNKVLSTSTLMAFGALALPSIFAGLSKFTGKTTEEDVKIVPEDAKPNAPVSDISRPEDIDDAKAEEVPPKPNRGGMFSRLTGHF